MSPGLLVFFPVVALGVLAAVAFIVFAAISEVLIARRGGSVVRAGVCVIVSAAALVGLVAGWRFAVTDAERRSGWVDADGNGMLDPFEMGGYAWIDLNGGRFMFAWTVASAATIGVALLALRAVRDA